MRVWVSVISFAKPPLFILCVLFWALSLAGAQNVESISQQAEAYIARGEFGKAVEVLEKVLDQSPTDEKARNLMGIALTASGKLKEANAHFEKAVELNPKFYPARKNLGLNQLRLHRIKEAEVNFEQVLQYAPKDPVVHLSLGEIYFATRRFRQAVEQYDQSGELLKEYPQVVINFAKSCFESDQASKASELLEALERADAPTHFRAGLMLAELGNYSGSARQFELAKNTSANADALDSYQVGFNLMLAQLRSRRYPAAIQSAQELIAQGHGTAELYNLLSEAYESSGKTFEAYDALRTATKMDPLDENNYLDLVALSVDHVNYDLALDIANIGLQNIPKSYRLLLQRGAVRAFKGQYSEAFGDFESAAKLDPKRNLPHFAMSMALMQMDQMKKAIEILRRRVAASSEDYLIQYALGESLNRAGAAPGTPEEKEAIESLERSVQMNPFFADSRVALGKMLVKAGQIERAIAELEKALELDAANPAPLYPLATAYRKKGDTHRAQELFTKYEKLKADKEKLNQRSLLRILRADKQ